MEYKKINKEYYLIIYIILIVVIIVTQYLIKEHKNTEKIDLKTEEQFQSVLKNRKNKEITDNLSTFIGKTVNWETSNPITKSITWQILYADEYNTYLIAKDYIDTDTQMPDKNLDEKNGDYSYSQYTISFEYGDNSKVVNYLLNKSRWKDLYNNENHDVNWAIGSPTMELYTKAHNAKYGTNFVSLKNNEGYINPTKSNNLIMEDDTFILKNSNKTDRLWLAAEDGSGKAIEYVWVVDNNSQCFITSSTNNFGGLRPVVALKSSIELDVMYDM